MQSTFKGKASANTKDRSPPRSKSRSIGGNGEHSKKHLVLEGSGSKKDLLVETPAFGKSSKAGGGGFFKDPLSLGYFESTGNGGGVPQ